LLEAEVVRRYVLMFRLDVWSDAFIVDRGSREMVIDSQLNLHMNVRDGESL
jgi:hypothetical protein